MRASLKFERGRDGRGDKALFFALIMKYSLINCNTASGEKIKELESTRAKRQQRRRRWREKEERGAGVNNVFGADSHLEVTGAIIYVAMII